MKNFKIKVSGKVQGVWFRQSTLDKARELRLAGTVRNMPDGTVEIEAEGEEPNLQKLISWCRQGPEHAEVADVAWEEGKLKGYEAFSIS